MESEAEARSQLECFKARRESPPVLIGLVERLENIAELGSADWPPLAEVHPAGAGCWLVGRPVERIHALPKGTHNGVLSRTMPGLGRQRG